MLLHEDGLLQASDCAPFVRLQDVHAEHCFLGGMLEYLVVEVGHPGPLGTRNNLADGSVTELELTIMSLY